MQDRNNHWQNHQQQIKTCLIGKRQTWTKVFGCAFASSLWWPLHWAASLANMVAPHTTFQTKKLIMPLHKAIQKTMRAAQIKTVMPRKSTQTTRTQKVLTMKFISAKQNFRWPQTQSTSSPRWVKWFCCKENIKGAPSIKCGALTAKKLTRNGWKVDWTKWTSPMLPSHCMRRWKTFLRSESKLRHPTKDWVGIQ